jgi:hypothetical protein
MAPPTKRPKRSKITKISLPAHQILNSNTPVIDQDLHGFITTALSPALWDGYSEAEKRSLINLFPAAHRKYNVDANGNLQCPVSVEFLQSDTYVKAGLARFKRDVKDGYWEAKWQDRARKAMEERREGKFDEYLRDHAEECFGEETADQAENDDDGNSESDWEQEHRRKKVAEEEEYVVERLLRLSPDGTRIEVKWAGYGKTTWESRAALLEDIPEMVAAMEAQQSGDLGKVAIREEEQTTTQEIHSVLPGPVNVVEGPDSGMKDEMMDGSRDSYLAPSTAP